MVINIKNLTLKTASFLLKKSVKTEVVIHNISVYIIKYVLVCHIGLVFVFVADSGCCLVWIVKTRGSSG